jgi:hypothetical protein
MLALVVIAVTALTFAMLLTAVWIADREPSPPPLDEPARRLHDSVAADKTSELAPVARGADHPDEGI